MITIERKNNIDPSSYYILNDDNAVGEIEMKFDKDCHRIYLYKIKIYDEYRRRGYAEEAIGQLFDQFDCTCIVGEILNSKEAKEFWKNMFNIYLSIKTKDHTCKDTCAGFFLLNIIKDNLKDELKQTIYY